MLTEYFERSISRANRNLALVGVAFILCGILFALFQLRLIEYFLLGPHKANVNAISAATPESMPGQFMRIDTELSGEIGTLESTRAGTPEPKVLARFQVARVDGWLLLIKTGPYAIKPPFEGRLTQIPDEVSKEILAPAFARQPDLKRSLRPVMFDATDRRDAAAAFIAVSCIPAFIGLSLLVLFAHRASNVRNHPSYRAIGRFGVPAMIAKSINGEAQYLAPESGKPWFTTSWIVVPTLFGVRTFRYKDLVWVHVRSFARCAVFRDRFGVVANVARGFTVSKANQVVSALASRAPWVLYGYTPQHARGWSTDRAGMIRYVAGQLARHEASGDSALNSDPSARRAPRRSEPPSEWSPRP